MQCCQKKAFEHIVLKVIIELHMQFAQHIMDLTLSEATQYTSEHAQANLPDSKDAASCYEREALPPKEGKICGIGYA